MKKFFVVLVLLVFASGSAFASVSNPTGGNESTGGTGAIFYPGWSDRAYMPKDNRLERLGGTGTALSTGVSSLFYNPANLAEHKYFMLNIPSINFGVYGLARYANIDGMMDLMKNVISGNIDLSDIGNMINVVTKLLQVFNYGMNPFVDLQADVGFTVGGFGLDVFAAPNVAVYNLSGKTNNTKIIADFAGGVSLGYGHKFEISDKVDLSFGVSVSMIMRTYMQGFGLSDLEALTGGNILDFIKSRPTAVGLQFPTNVGFTTTISDKLRFSIAYRNLFSGMKAYQYSDLGDWLKNPFRVFKGSKDSIGSVDIGETSSLDVGIAYNPKWKWFNPRLEIDFVNLTKFGKSDDYKISAYDYTNFFSHFRVGLELFLGEFLRLGVGLNMGRVNFGLTIDLWPIVIDVDYGWYDTTPTLGEAMADRLSVNVKLGWDRSK